MRLNFLLAAATALLLILAFPSFNIALLAPIALAPLLVAVARCEGLKRPFLLGWTAGVIYWAAVCYWIEIVLAEHAGMAAWAAWLGFVLFCVAKALHLGVFALGAAVLLRRRWAALTVPALWVAIERTHGELGFAWLTLGNAGIGMSLPARLAPLTGVYGISFVFALMATAVALAVLRRPRVELSPVVLVLALVLVPALPEARRGKETAVLVQPNISESATWTPQWTRETRDRLELLSLRAVMDDPKNPPSLVVWPEAPAPAYYYNDAGFRDEVNALARRLNTYLILNVTPFEGQSPFNSALLVSPEGKPLGRYDKMNLVPFGEFVPAPFQALVNKVSSEGGDFLAGRKQAVLAAGAHRLGVFICYESVFPDFVRRFAPGGAEVLVNISNDGWYGHSAAREQHLQLVRMRAAESRRWILRATNDGVTSTVDPAGRVVRNLAPYTEGAVRTAFSYESALTLYSRWGDWFVWLSAVIAIAGLAEAWHARRVAR